VSEVERAEPVLVPAVEGVSKPGRIERPRVPIRALARPAGHGRQTRGHHRGETEVERNGIASEAPRRETCVPRFIRPAGKCDARSQFVDAAEANDARLSANTAGRPSFVDEKDCFGPA
jgi:hypothetical protein